MNEARCITGFTPTLCELFGIAAPGLAGKSVHDEVVRAGRRAFGAGKLEKCLVFSPDAVGAALCRAYETDFGDVSKHAPIKAPTVSVDPAKTPVCFASMFTGALPAVHGIRRYERPVLECDTLFDALRRAGKRVAIIAVKNSSMDLIFRERDLDYFSEAYDGEVVDRVCEALRSGTYDFIAAYQQEYDDVLHETTPTSPQAITAMRNHIASFCTVADAAETHWRRHNRAVVFAPDHGAHVDAQSGKGTHGEAIAEDLEIVHHFGLACAENPAKEIL